MRVLTLLLIAVGLPTFPAFAEDSKIVGTMVLQSAGEGFQGVLHHPSVTKPKTRDVLPTLDIPARNDLPVIAGHLAPTRALETLRLGCGDNATCMQGLTATLARYYDDAGRQDDAQQVRQGSSTDSP